MLANAFVLGSQLPKDGARNIAKAAMYCDRAHRAAQLKTENSIAMTTTAGRTCPGLVRLPAPETLRHCGHPANMFHLSHDDEQRRMSVWSGALPG